MTIEIECPSCGKLLRTSDDKAGMSAKCPGCGGAITIPQSASLRDEFDLGEADEFEENAVQPAAPAASAGGTKRCPVCGEEIKAAAVVCRFCGEDLGGGRSAEFAGGGLKPHRGTMMLVMGIVSLALSFMCACCIVFGVAGISLSITTVVLARNDLKEMQAGVRDPAGHGLTKAGLILCIVQLSIVALEVLAWVGFMVFQIMNGNGPMGGPFPNRGF